MVKRPSGWQGRGIPGSRSSPVESESKQPPKVPDNILKRPLTMVPPMKRVKDS